jgi:crotonobetainyl-CoA:carnitine CoA-transferase CaiB-like acyl-CoA transferase
MSAGVLAGLRVLDFGRYVAGPYCATLLGYLGAEVIRIEKLEGSEDRFIAPVAAGGEGGVFFQTACNKKSLTLDPATPAGREVVRRLVHTADIVVANLPPASLRTLGLDYASLSAIRPDIILVSQSSFGDRGPLAARGGFDGVGQAMSGAMYMTGTPGEPTKSAAPYVDFSTATLSAFGAMAALLYRAQTGQGQEVKANLLGTALAVFGSQLIEQGVLGKDRVPSGNRVQTSAPSDVFRTMDGHVLTHVVGNGLFKRWARLMGDPDRWLDDPRFQGDQARGDNAEEILARMRAWCAARTTAQALRELDAAGLPAGPVHTLQQALDQPQAAAMQMFRSVADYPGLPRPALVPDLPLELTASPGGITRRPPLLGEHTEEILGSLGYTTVDIAELRKTRVV